MQPWPPCSAPACSWQMWALGVAVRHVICGFSFFLSFSSRLCCPLRFQNCPQTHKWECFLVFENFSPFKTPSPGQVSISNSFVSLFIFYILSYLLLKTMGCLSGCLVSSASVQRLFCEICSAFKWSFDEFVGEKVVFPSYSSTIFGLPPKVLLWIFQDYIFLSAYSCYLSAFLRKIHVSMSTSSSNWNKTNNQLSERQKVDFVNGFCFSVFLMAVD